MSKPATFTVEEILQQLDDCADDFRFPMLNNAYFFLADVRLSGYADRKRWVLIIETLGYNYRMGLPEGLQNDLSVFGNCLRDRPGHAEAISPLIEDDVAQPAFTEDGTSFINDAAQTIRIRGEAVPIPRGPVVLAAKGITLANAPRMRAEELMRALLPEHRKRLLATEEELQWCFPKGLPLVIRLDQWHHPDLADDERPGDNFTFQSIADVLVHRDPNRYRADLAPNTHWKNWPLGGSV
jgi:hypothetical protein